jgi:hypothetical protein
MHDYICMHSHAISQHDKRFSAGTIDMVYLGIDERGGELLDEERKRKRRKLGRAGQRLPVPPSSVHPHTLFIYLALSLTHTHSLNVI